MYCDICYIRLSVIKNLKNLKNITLYRSRFREIFCDMILNILIGSKGQNQICIGHMLYSKFVLFVYVDIYAIRNCKVSTICYRRSTPHSRFNYYMCYQHTASHVRASAYALYVYHTVYWYSLYQLYQRDDC